MSISTPLYYWDACIFLEYIKKEAVPPQRRHAVQKLLYENKGRANAICTSSISHLECLPKKLNQEDSEREKEYMSMFGTRFFYDVPISSQVLLLAREIRDFYYAEDDPKTGTAYRMMSLGDAIHLATAIIEGATAFHTRDGNRRGGNVPLLGLAVESPGGRIAGRYDLDILSPEDAQTDIVDLAEEATRGKSA